nr:unnamed protein product [Spirometra erinaceieuropaei]
MRIHESGNDRNLDAPTPPSPTPNSSPCAPTNHSSTDIDATDSTTPHSSPSSSSSSFTATTMATPASVAHDFTTAAPDTTTGTTPATSIIRGEGQDYICPHCDRTCTSLIGLVGHLRIHRTETGEPVPGVPTYTHRIRLHCPHRPRTFMHRMGLFGHILIHESGIDHNSDTPTTPIMLSTTLPPFACTTTNASSVADTDTAEFTCPYCPRTFTSRIGLVGHLRIHRTETGEPVPGAPTYTHKARLNCPHCLRTFRHRMGLFGHMRIHDDLRNELAQRLDNLPIAVAAAENASVENRWCQLRDTVQSTALAVLGRAPRQHQDWFDDNDAAITNLLAEKNRLQKAYVDHPTEDNKAAFYRSRRQLQQRLREMQDAWTARKAEEIQGYADRNEWKNFFSAIKAVYGPPTKGTAPLLRADGSTLLTEKTQILQRWAEHFRGVLNRSSVISDAAIARLPQVETNVDLDLPPSLQETIRAVQQLSSGKAPGSDAIPAERKGNRQVCDNHRGISLLNIAGKIFARILLNRLTNHLEQGLLPESQCGFRRHRGTTDMIFAARQLQEKCQEMRTHLYSTFVDLTKAFDTVNREGLWKIMQKFGCPEQFIQMVRQLHNGMMARVTDNGAVSETFAVTNGVKQGCVLAPTLFSLMFSAMLMDAYRDERPGIRIA